MLNVRRFRASFWAFGVVLLATGLALPSSPLDAQQPAPQGQDTPVFRGGTTFVSVDAYPRRDGRVVEGLTADDFEVYEDGVRQAIENFRFIRIEPNPADSARRDPVSTTDSNQQAADPRNRLFVVYLDQQHTTIAGSYYARQPIVDFLTRTIGDQDLFGVLTAEVPVGQLTFARRTETLEGELAKYWPWGLEDRAGTEARTVQERRLLECRLDGIIPLSREDRLMTSLEHLMMRLGDLRDERKNVLFISEGWVPRGPRTDLVNATVSRGAVPGIGVAPGGRIGIGGTMQPWGQDAAWCDSELARLAAIDFEKRFTELLTSAIRANVSFYPVDVGGLRTSATRATDTLRTLAENTDGFAVVTTNDLTGGVRRISNDLAAFYLMGYYSTNGTANGRFRRIEVRVKQPDVRVSARRGYLAPTAAMLASASAPRAVTGPSPVDAALARLASARADNEWFVSSTPTPSGIHVAVELAPTTAARQAWRGGATVRVAATGPGGATASEEVTIAPGARGTELTLATPPAPGAWDVVVEASASGDERLQQRVELPGITTRLVGPALAWRAASSPRAPLRPLADARLTRVERLRVEWPVIARSDRTVVRLLDRTGKPLGQPLPLANVDGSRPVIAIDLPLGALPEGDYVVELVATAAEVSEQQLLAFRVTR